MVLKDAFLCQFSCFCKSALFWYGGIVLWTYVSCTCAVVLSSASVHAHESTLTSLSHLCAQALKKEPKPLRKKTVAAFFARTFVNNWHGQSHDKAIRVPRFSLAMILLRYLKQIRSEMGNFRTSCLIFSSFIFLSLSCFGVCVLHKCAFLSSDSKKQWLKDVHCKVYIMSVSPWRIESQNKVLVKSMIRFGQWWYEPQFNNHGTFSV